MRLRADFIYSFNFPALFHMLLTTQVSTQNLFSYSCAKELEMLQVFVKKHI